jgi:CBS domain containing-hemolysin-like protein
MSEQNQNQIRNWLALGITGIAMIGIVILGGAVILAKEAEGNKAQMVLNAVLPLFGTWVGTVLAFFFARDNFESASRNAREFMTTQEKLQSLPVTSAMTPRDKMEVVKEPDNPSLIEKLDELEKRGIKRLPILSQDNYPKALIFKDGIFNYLYRGDKPRSDEDLKTLTMQNLLDEQSNLSQPYGIVGEQSTLADAQEAMRKKTGCHVVFVTKSGRENDVVIGMLTNRDIAEKAIV